MDAELRLEPAISDLARILFTRMGVDDTLGTITGAVQRAIPTCTAASITMLERGRPSTPASTSSAATEADQAQYDSGGGPCLTAIETAGIVSIASMTRHSRWPEFRDAALERGIRSSLSLPLNTGDDVIGALNLYGDTEEAFSESASVGAVVFAAQAAITMANAQAFQQADALAKNLEAALEHRDVIGQAKGLLMASSDRTPDEAFDVLRRASQRTNRKLYDVAQDIVERRSAHDLDET